MITRDEIYQKAGEAKVDPNIIEKDYYLGIVLRTIAQSPMTSDWIFRGGTALKKCYFTNYRFSEDLDFTLANRKLRSAKDIKTILENICHKSNEQFGVTLEFFNAKQEREEYGEEAFKGILHFQSIKGKSKIKIDLSFVDKIFIEAVSREIYHNYSDDAVFGKFTIKAARLEEIISDKFMAVSFIRTYPRTRDLFDIWYIAGNEKLDLKLIKDTFEKKCEFRKLDKNFVNQIDKIHLKQFKKYWEAHLASLVGDLPEFEKIVDAVIAYRDKIFGR